MQKEFWQQKWESNQIGFNQDTPNTLLTQYIGSLTLKSGNRIFVPLCGKSIDMFWLLGQGFEVVGVELSSIACEAFFFENNIPVNVTRIGNFVVYRSKGITILCGDFFELTKEMLGDINAVFDRAALIALPPDLQQRYVSFITKLLEPNTPVLLIVGTYNQSEMSGPPFSIDENRVRELYGKRYDIKLLCNRAAEEIPAHLKARGLAHISEQAYCLTVE